MAFKTNSVNESAGRARREGKAERFGNVERLGIARKALRVSLALFVIAALMPLGFSQQAQPAYAATNVPYVDQSGAAQVAATATDLTSSTTAWTTGWYTVSSSVTISSRIVVAGNVNLILQDGLTLSASAGITVSSGNSLTIYGQTNGNGTLMAQGSGNVAGIGGDASSQTTATAGSITINGGTVNVTGGDMGAGIGGAGSPDGSIIGNGGTITINRGSVTALGGSNHGAGIGGGGNGNGGTITITGGTVNATGGAYGGAGIGGGAPYNHSPAGAGGNITISGGSVTARGNSCVYGGGAGIGGGGGGNPDTSGDSGNITITGNASVTSTGGSGGSDGLWTTAGGGGAAVGTGGANGDSTTLGTCQGYNVFINTSGTLSLTAGTGQGSALNGAQVGYGGSTTSAGAELIPTAPQNLAASAGNAQVTLTWSTPLTTGQPITNYLVESSTDGGATWSSPTTIGNVSSYTATGLTNGTACTFQVTAVNPVNSASAVYNWSNTASATPQPTAPGAPQAVAAASGAAQLTVTFSPPSFDGNSAITSYTVYASPSGGGAAITATGAASPVTVTGLTNGVTYNVTVTATNAVGEGPASSPAVAATPSTTPSAPTNLAATPGDGFVALTWADPLDNGGSPITSYQYSINGGVSWTAVPGSSATTASYTVSGLTDGVSYTFGIRAVNANGPGASSSIVSATPVAVPGAPTLTSVTPGDTQATVVFSSPASDGGSAITAYTVTAQPQPTGTPIVTTGTASPITVTGLTNGTPYSFTVTATNAVGTGAASTAQSATPYTTPSAPQALAATPGDTTVDLSWTAPASDGGSAITSYEVSDDGGANWLPVTAAPPTTYSFAGLTNGTTYTFLVRADNAAGPGAEASVQATPFNPAALAPDAPANLAAVPANGEVDLTWDIPTGNPVDSYEYSVDGGSTWSAIPGSDATTTSFNITSLSNGTTYSIGVRGVSTSYGEGAASLITATPFTTPGEPQNVAAAAGNTQIVVTFDPPLSDGGSPISSYTVTATPTSGAPVTASGSASPFTITGLTNGMQYSITVYASNAAGDGPATPAPASPLLETPATTPGTPLSLTATPGNGAVTLNWITPASNGGSPITYYEASTDGGATWNTIPASGPATTSFTQTGLTAGTLYTLGIRAVNDVGAGASALIAATPLNVPTAPQNVAAAPGNAQASVTFAAPVSDGGEAISSYTVTATPSGGGATVTQSGAASPIAVSGLINGQLYSITVVASNAAGDSPASAPAVLVTPFTVPDAPTTPSATPADGTIALTWTAPVSDGGSPITSYDFSTDGGVSWYTIPSSGAATTSFTLTGLTNGVTYNPAVRAVNAAGVGAALFFGVTIPVGLASAPTGVTAVPGAGSATIAWGAPASNGGSAIISYTIVLTAQPAGTPFTIYGWPGSPFTAFGLTNGTSYLFTVAAVTAEGTGAASAPVFVTPTNVPDSPSGLIATPGNQQVTLSWTAGANGGSPITNYLITVSGSSRSINTGSDATSFTVGGLTNGIAYTFTVVAVNAAGMSTPPVSAMATPAGPVLITTISLPVATTTVPYSQTLSYTGFPAPSWAVSSGSLPPGLSLNSGTGVLSGTPTVRGTYAFTITADNGYLPIPSQAFTVAVEVPSTYVYPVIQDFGTWTGSGTAAALVDANYLEFQQLVVASTGLPVPTAYYSVSSGSTKISFTEAYLNTLSNGTYYYIAQFNQFDSAQIMLVINRPNAPAPPPTPTPAPGGGMPVSGDDPTLLIVVIALACAAVVLLTAGIIIYRKSRKKPNRPEQLEQLEKPEKPPYQPRH